MDIADVWYRNFDVVPIDETEKTLLGGDIKPTQNNMEDQAPYQNSQGNAPAERFIKPTDEEIIEFALIVNKGKLQMNKLADMVSLCIIIIDRLYENGDMRIPSQQELDDAED